MKYIYLDEMDWNAEIINGKKKLKARASPLEKNIVEEKRTQWKEFITGKRDRFILENAFSAWRVK